MVASISHGESLSEALRFVVNRARADRIHISPISLLLRVLERIAVALRGGSLKELRRILARNLQRVERSVRADLQRFNTMLGIIARAGGRGKVEDEVDGPEVEG